VTDTSGRIIADALGKRLGQQVVPDNRPGASGNIGSQIVAQAEPDGHTLLLVLDGTFVINPHVYDKMPFDPVRDFATIGKIGDSTTILVAHPGFKANNLRELVELSKSQPGGLSYGTSGTGSIVHIAGELLKQRTGANLVHVPYKGGAPAIADVIGGQVNIMFLNMPTGLGQVKAGKVRILGVTSAKRVVQLPDVPTIDEAGLKGFETAAWSGVYVPMGTPRDIITRLNTEIVKILKMPSVREQLAGQGAEPVGDTPEEFAQFTRSEIAKWAQVVKASGAKVE
jgi:tripartite-type tricarboxylate transporter receptor subunit TctC